MRTINKSAEIVGSADRVLLPDRYSEPFVEAYQLLTGREVPVAVGREASITSQGVSFQRMRGRDIPRITALMSLVDPSILTVGLTGSEWYMEYLATAGQRPETKAYRISEERFGRVALVAPSDSNPSMIRSRLDRAFNPVGVVTAYPNMVNNLGLSGQFNLATKVAVSGGVEGIAKALKLPAVDLVGTGETIRENGFAIVAELMDVYPIAVTTEQSSLQC